MIENKPKKNPIRASDETYIELQRIQRSTPPGQKQPSYAEIIDDWRIRAKSPNVMAKGAPKLSNPGSSAPKNAISSEALRWAELAETARMAKGKVGRYFYKSLFGQLQQVAELAREEKE
jgi:hypothetical protein